MRLVLALGATALVGLASAFAAESRPLYYSANPLYPPYHWASDDGSFDGASLELLTLVLPRSIDARPVREPWKRALAMAAEGEIDLLLSLRVTPERAEYLAFATHRAFPNPIAVFVRRGSPIAVDDWASLKAYVGGVSLGDYFGGGFDEYWKKELRVEVAPSMVENFEKLRLSRIDYFVSGFYMGRSYLSARGLQDEIVALRPFISDQDIYFAMSKKSPYLSLLPIISRKLAELDASGALDALLMKHLARFASKPAPPLFR